jgi:hypothetical protein
MHIFRIKEYRAAIGVSRQLGDVLLKSGLMGFSLDPVNLSLPSDAPGYEVWIAERKIQVEERERLVQERKGRLGLVPKFDGTEYKPGDPYPVDVPDSGPFKEFPNTIPFPEPSKPRVQ